MRKSFLLLGAALLAVLALAGAGCGKTTGADVAKEIGKAKQAEVKDVCKYFPKELVEEAIGKPIVRAANDNGIYDACQYYTAYTQDFDHTPYGDHPGGPHIIVVLNDKDEAIDKADFEKDGYKFEKDPSFSWEHYLVTSPGSKTPFRVDLIVDNNSYFMIKSNHFAATDAEIVKIGKRLSEKMKNGN